MSHSANLGSNIKGVDTTSVSKVRAWLKGVQESGSLTDERTLAAMERTATNLEKLENSLVPQVPHWDSIFGKNGTPGHRWTAGWLFTASCTPNIKALADCGSKLGKVEERPSVTNAEAIQSLAPMLEEINELEDEEAIKEWWMDNEDAFKDVSDRYSDVPTCGNEVIDVTKCGDSSIANLTHKQKDLLESSAACFNAYIKSHNMDINAPGGPKFDADHSEAVMAQCGALRQTFRDSVASTSDL